MQDLARCMADEPAQVLHRLVRLALEICGGDSAGVSVLEDDVFRWYALEGGLAAFDGATTPRDWSPCGVCLDCGEPILMRHPEDVYDWIADADIVVPEVLLVPLLANGKAPIGTLWVIGKSAEAFSAGHARMMHDLAIFAGVALHMIDTGDRLNAALDAQRVLAREMSHRVKNVFAVTNSMINMAARTAGSSEELAESATGRLMAMSQAHDLVGSAVVRTTAERTADLRELLTTLIAPHGDPDLEGPSLVLNEQAVHALSLVVHELATNATKYGAFSQHGGTVIVRWEAEKDVLTLHWTEVGGPSVTAATTEGFGSALIGTSLAPVKGGVSYDWASDGLGVTITIPTDRALEQQAC